jgi:hypothetical protein
MTDTRVQVTAAHFHGSLYSLFGSIGHPEEPTYHRSERERVSTLVQWSGGLIFAQQDSLGKAISLKRRYTDDNDVWAGPLSDGSTVVRELALP